MVRADEALRRLVEALGNLQISFLVVGSVASSIHGLVGATRGLDLVASVEPRHIDGLVAALEKEFYIDADMIRQALSAGRSFNLIHYATAYKFDIFPLGSGSFDASQFQRRTPAAVSLGRKEFIDVPVASAEDTLLSKLVWFRAGGEVSDRQWHDIRGIVEIKREQLDRAYLRLWAAHLKVEDLLDRVLAQSGA